MGHLLWRIGLFVLGFFSLNQSFGEAGHGLLSVLLKVPYRLKTQDPYQVSNYRFIYDR